MAQYLNTQIEAGAQAVMIFDSWGGVLADGALPSIQPALRAPRVLSQLRRHHDGEHIPPSSSPRAADCGWKKSPTPAVTRWAWTGP